MNVYPTANIQKKYNHFITNIDYNQIKLFNYDNFLIIYLYEWMNECDAKCSEKENANENEIIKEKQKKHKLKLKM